MFQFCDGARQIVLILNQNKSCIVKLDKDEFFELLYMWEKLRLESIYVANIRIEEMSS